MCLKAVPFANPISLQTFKSSGFEAGGVSSYVREMGGLAIQIHAR